MLISGATPARLATYVGLAAPTDFVEECCEEAEALVAAYISSLWPNSTLMALVTENSGVPDAVLERAIIEVAAELYHRKNTKNAVAQFATPDGSPVRIARDPMVAAYPLLRPWVGGGFA